MKNTIYTLPQDDFVAGQTRKYAWRLLRESGHLFNANGCEGAFSLLDYSHKEDDPILVKKLDFSAEDEGVISVATVTLEPKDTIGLDGKFIYQLSIKDPDGNIEIPNQGIFFISNNIHKAFVNL